MIWTRSVQDWWRARISAYCHNASLCRLIRCQLRESDHDRCADAGLGEDECDAEAEEALPRLSESDLLESEKETLESIWSAVLGRRECHMFLFLFLFLSLSRLTMAMTMTMTMTSALARDGEVGVWGKKRGMGKRKGPIRQGLW